MAFNGSGLFSRLYNWVNDRDANIDITASRMDAEMDGFATGLTNCITKNGVTTPTANLKMGGYKHTNVATASAKTHYAQAGQVTDGAFTYALDTGAADAYAIAMLTTVTAYATGQRFVFKAVNANTGASTLAVDGLAAKAITDVGTNALIGGEILANGFYEVVYDGTQFQLLNPEPATVGTGKQTVWIPSTAMTPTTTNGAAAAVTELATNDVMVSSLNFDASTDEKAQFSFLMPKGWNEGTVTAKFVWSHPTTTTNFGVAWFLQGTAFSDGDAMDASWGTAVGVTDTGGTTDDVYVTSETAAITIGGTPAEEDFVVMQVYRDVSDAGDTMAVDARLMGVRLLYTTDANTDD